MPQSFLLPYGQSHVCFEFPDDQEIDVYEPVDTPGADDPVEEVRTALETLIDGSKFTQFSGARSAAIAINDKTRPVPHHHILPPLIDQLKELGIPELNIRFFIATGTHTPMPRDEFERVLPKEFLGRFSVESHDCDDLQNLQYLGQTSYGTPVWINRRYLEADLRIVVGTLEPHHFMGFSGGAKTAGIDLGGRETINQSHALLMHPNARIGAYDDNPIRQDLEEIGALIGIHLAVNVVLNAKREIVRALAGSPLAVMRAGIPIARAISQTPAKHPYDLVIASAGGHPKDINLYQSQKALSHAGLIIRERGVIILVAACPEGSGSAGFEAFIQGIHTPQEVFAKFEREGFRIGPHKAFQIARDVSRANIIAITDLQAEKSKQFLLTPADNPQHALELAAQWLPKDPKIAILPKATQTIPILPITS